MARTAFTGATRFADAQTAEAAAIAAGKTTHIWVVPAENKVWLETDDDVQVIVDTRPTVTKWQLIQACVDAGVTEAQIDQAVLTLTAKRQRFWKYTNIIDRDNPISTGIRSSILPTPPTPQAWNAIFRAAARLDPLLV